MVMGSGVLGPLFPQPNLSWVDTYSVAHAGTSAALERADSNGWPRITVLLFASRYYFFTDDHTTVEI